ncbi:MAG: PSD1 domain-containing protein, partial [Planctomycetaceae bacterium]|nr:PSD1 domain-containing protein [Planctomycetaceae bacterium]
MFFARLLALACFLSPILFSQIGFALEPVEFERDIAPILLTRCVECHNDTDASGGLNLTSSATLKAGSDSGEVLSPSHLEESYLWERVADGDMPPEKQGKPQPLPDSEKALLKRWIESGAAWPENRKLDLFEKTTNVRGGRDWWSLRPVVKPNLPTLNQLPEDANSVDHFILAKLAEQNLEPAPLAEPKQLLRRLYYDLTGLPPTAETLEEFAQDPSLENYERHVDQLLASPRFGERWARYWLDLVRFAETSGYERDQVKEHIWKYRDYVINAINEDKPYNQFVLEQLAGDELSNRSEETVIATGFLRLGTWNDEPNDPGEYIYERLEDMVHVTSSAFLGLTIKCARCHDHKFDPIPQTDYYRMASTFWAGPIKPRDRKYIGGPTPEELGFDVCGWTDLGREVSDLHLLKKGDPKHPGPVVEPAHLSFLPELEKPFESPAESDKTSQRRLQLAEWITDPQNPLTPRVMVNRLWQHHFGDALVRSPNNFGFTGAQPTHPELLDWLAAELQEGNWKLKRLHKLLVMSRTYRQSSLHPQYAEYAEQDFANNYWWRANRRRLDAEAFRDSLVNAAGILDLT